MRSDIVVEQVAGTFLFSGETERGKEWLASRTLLPPLVRIGRAVEVPDGKPVKDLVAAATADGLQVEL